MRKTSLVILLLAFFSVAAQAQNNISVTSFKWLENDLLVLKQKQIYK